MSNDDGIAKRRVTGRGGAFAGLRRLARYRLVVPILRGHHHSADYTARAVFVGLLVAFTPTVGVQMPIVAAIWGGVRAVRPSWSFNLVIALAWTWVTNVVTVPPIYYVFLITGQAMLGHWSDILGYQAFSARLAHSLVADGDCIEALWAYVLNLLDAFGLPIFLGCLPWTLLVSWLGYRWSLKAAHRLRALRERRLRTTRERPIV